MAQWVKNLTATAQVAAEVQVCFLAWHSWLKDSLITAVAQIQILAQELLYALGAAIKKNSTFIYDKHSPQSGYRGNIHQHNRGHI